jgi:hypothetical protein
LPETVLEAMLPGLDLRLVSIGFDNSGNVVLDIEGSDVPAGARDLLVTMKREFLKGKTFRSAEGGVFADSFSITAKA